MKIVLLINKSAGSGDSESESSKILAAFKTKNVNVEIFNLPGDEVKDKIAESDYDAVVAAGGDGTISSVVNLIADKNIPFGVIPLGTLNHFAKDAGIPLTLDEAVDVIAGKKISETDIAEVNGNYFINNSSIGIYPKMVKHRDKEMEKWGYGKWYAMFRALLNIFTKYPLLNLRINTENIYSEITAPFIFVGNNRYTMDLFNPGKREKVNEGLLSLYFPETSGKLSMIRFAFLALINKLHQAEDFHTTVCSEIKISSEKKILEVSTDGEVLHLETPLEYKIHPRKLKLIVPSAE